MAETRGHLDRERLSALLDGETDAEAREHLEACAPCRQELETLRRMRMALSAMDDLDPPADGWDRIEAALPRPASGDVPAWRAGSGWLRAAAAALLFAVGLGVGARLGPDWGGGTRRAAGTDTATLAAAGEGSGADSTYRSALQRLEALRASGPSPDEAYRDPAAAAEHLARLDAVIRATREALHEDPADPAMNDFLFEVVEQRQELNQALQLATLEYR